MQNPLFGNVCTHMTVCCMETQTNYVRSALSSFFLFFLYIFLIVEVSYEWSNSKFMFKMTHCQVLGNLCDPQTHNAYYMQLGP